MLLFFLILIYNISFSLSRCLVIGSTWLKRLQVFQLFAVNNCGLLTQSCIGVCVHRTRMPSSLKWEDFICHSFHWCWCNEQVCGWWMAWPFLPLYNQVFLVVSYDSFVVVLHPETVWKAVAKIFLVRDVYVFLYDIVAKPCKGCTFCN